MKKTYFRKKVYIMLRWFFGFYILGLIVDFVPAVSKGKCVLFSNLYSAMRFNSQNWESTLLTIYCLAWTVMIGFIVFIVQHDSGYIMGLKPLNIMYIIFSDLELKCSILFLIIKLGIYGMAVLYMCKGILCLGIVEIFVNLCLNVDLFISLTDEKNAILLLEENTKESFNNTTKRADLSSRGDFRRDWIIKSAVQHMDYNSEDECHALIKILVYLCNQTIILKNDARVILIKMDSYIRQTEDLYELIEKIYFSLNDNKKMEYIICECIEEMDCELSTYLLIRGLLANPGYVYPREEIITILGHLQQEHQRYVLMRLIVFTGVMYNYSSEKGWSRVYLDIFKNELKKICRVNQCDWDLVKDVFFVEVERYDYCREKKDVRSMISEYHRLLTAILRYRRIQ